MPKITDPPPPEVAAELATLDGALDAAIPSKALDKNLLIATWNLRAFGGLTDKWAAEDDDSPKRDLHAALAIARIAARFDVVALQEVKGNLKALRHLLKALGPHWGLVLTDVTRGDPGNDERMAFVYDTRRLRMSGLACELVMPEAELAELGEGALRRQFARTPYAVSFRSGRRTFILVTLHVLYGENAAERVPELRAIARWMADWARDVNAYHHNVIALGDFNIDRRGDALYEAFTSTGLTIPDDLNAVPRSIFHDPEEGGKFYDQIAWFSGEGGAPALSLPYLQGGHFDFVGKVLADRGLSRQSLSWRISDHYPLWAEMSLRG